MFPEGGMVMPKQEGGNCDNVDMYSTTQSKFEDIYINDNRSTRYHLLNQASIDIKCQEIEMVCHFCVFIQ